MLADPDPDVCRIAVQSLALTKLVLPEDYLDMVQYLGVTSRSGGVAGHV